MLCFNCVNGGDVESETFENYSLLSFFPLAQQKLKPLTYKGKDVNLQATKTKQ